MNIENLTPEEMCQIDASWRRGSTPDAFVKTKHLGPCTATRRSTTVTKETLEEEEQEGDPYWWIGLTLVQPREDDNSVLFNRSLWEVVKEFSTLEAAEAEW